MVPPFIETSYTGSCTNSLGTAPDCGSRQFSQLTLGSFYFFHSIAQLRTSLLPPANRKSPLHHHRRSSSAASRHQRQQLHRAAADAAGQRLAAARHRRTLQENAHVPPHPRRSLSPPEEVIEPRSETAAALACASLFFLECTTTHDPHLDFLGVHIHDDTPSQIH